MPWNTFLIHVVVGIVFDPEGKVLIAQRPANQYAAGLWEFPGGKVERHEAAFNALKREFQEEIGIQIISAQFWFKKQHVYPDRTILLDNWFVQTYLGIPYGAEGQQIRWVLPSELTQFEFPEGNKEIIHRLRFIDNLRN